MGRVGFWRRTVAGIVWVSLIVGVVAYVSGPALGLPVFDNPDWMDGLEPSSQDDEPELSPMPEASSAASVESEPTEPLSAESPEPGSQVVTLGNRGESTQLTVEGEVTLSPETSVAAGAEVQVEVLDQATAQRAGVSGFVFRMTGAGSSSDVSELGGGSGLPANLNIDYSGFETAFGAGYGDRLQVVALPACALLEPRPSGCLAGGVPLAVTNDTASKNLIVEVEDLGTLTSSDMAIGATSATSALPEAVNVTPTRPVLPDGVVLSEEQQAEFDAGTLDAGVIQSSETATSDAATSADSSGAVVLAVTSSLSGETGSFAASPLSLSSTWSVAPGSGEFAWSYPIPTPTPPAGSAPNVAVGYSSGSIDALTSVANTQAGPAGAGWGDFANAFVERRFTPCKDDGSQVSSNDLCWKQDNAFLTVDGHSGELVPVPGTNNTEWRLKNDPGWRIVRESTIPNEYWVVTAPDGTQYFFGWDAISRVDRDGVERVYTTGARWTVPVLADDPGEPCRGAGDTVGVCDQAWRSNLVFKREPNGVESRFFYEEHINHYRYLNGLGDHSTAYTQGGYLKQIEYGVFGAFGVGTATVDFGTGLRCDNLGVSCPAPSRQNASRYPDVPTEFLCANGEDCGISGPSFFSTRRYETIRTQVFADGGWRVVDSVRLNHDFLTNSEADKKLYLTAIQRTGRTNGQTLRLPPVTFSHTEKPNRRFEDSSGKLMYHFRVSGIRDEYGHDTTVTYGQPSPCIRGVRPPPGNCFSQRVGDVWGNFNKYSVMSVSEVDQGWRESDRSGTSPTMTTSYTYEGTAGWAWNDDPFLKPEAHYWTDWRGHGKVVITQGSSRTRVQVFRGLNNDILDGGRRSVSITTLDGSRSFPDEPWMAGAILDEETLSTSGTKLTRTLHEYESRPTVQPSADSLTWAVWASEASTTTSTLKPDGAYAPTRVRRTYNSHFQPETVLEEGWTQQTGDERCAKTTYANNQAAWMFTYPASVRLVSGDCASTNELTYSETFYDGSATLGAPPSQGYPTKQRTRIDDTTWTSNSTTFDPYGRPLIVTDDLGRQTKNDYEPAPRGEYPNWSKVTNALGHVETTEWLPDRGVPLKVTDANGKVTAFEYDGLGRFWKGWSPTEQGGAPTVQIAYLIDLERDAIPVVQTRRLTGKNGDNTDRFEDTWVLYDTLARERRTEVLSPESGKVIVAGTSYDDRGLVASTGMPQAVSASGGQWVDPVWDNRVNTSYDELGRPIREARLTGETEAAVTTSAYTHDTTTVTPAVGGAKRTIIDGLGRTIQVGEHDGTAWQTTVYGYDLADRLTAILDPAWNLASYTYDKAGRRVTSDDPDAGAWSYGYDLVGNLTRSTDAYNASTHTIFDRLNRPTERHQNSPTGPLLAKWAYDAPGELGLADYSSRVTSSGDWKTDITGYDARNRPLGTKWTVPAGIPGLSGDYAMTYGYDPADRLTSITYPGGGGLGPETITTRYNAYGLPDYMAGTEEYVWAAAYDDRGRPKLFGYGPRPGGQSWMGRVWTYNPEQRLSKMTTSAGGVTSEHSYTYDAIGQIKERTTQLGADDWRECFGYDQRNRLINARTVALNGTCQASTPDGGDKPYKHAYTYDAAGNMKTRTENGATSTYTYPAAGSDRPHAPTKVVTGSTTDTYTWGSNGELTKRVVSGKTENLTWDPEHRLATIAGTAGTDSFLYDASGERLMRSGPNGRTIYVAGQEISARLDGTNVRAVRAYSFGGELIATRSPGGVDYVVTDQQGSVEATFASGGAMETSRAYAPYGERRSGGEFDTDQGWIGQIEDDSSKLSYLHARYYDPNIATFISRDPILDLAKPKSLNGYGYGLANPTNNADPSGLCVSFLCAAALAAMAGALVRAGGSAVRAGASLSRSATQAAALSRTAGRLVRSGGGVARAAARMSQRAAVDAGNQALVDMCKVNCDPGFWKWLSAIGADSGQGPQGPGPRGAPPVPMGGCGTDRWCRPLDFPGQSWLEGAVDYVGEGLKNTECVLKHGLDSSRRNCGGSDMANDAGELFATFEEVGQTIIAGCATGTSGAASGSLAFGLTSLEHVGVKASLRLGGQLFVDSFAGPWSILVTCAVGAGVNEWVSNN